MGCMCSKAITRSLSMREELNHGFQSASVAWEELLTSNSGNDQLFSFLYSANTRTNELRTSSFTLPSSDLATNLETRYSVDALDLISDIKVKTEVISTPDVVGEPEFFRFTRSKSYQIQLPREKEMFGLISETEGLNENKLDWRDKNLRGSRSFHTVEEFDALLERIHKSSTSRESFEDYYSTADEKFHQLKSLDEDQNNGNIKRNTKYFLKKEAGTKADLDLDHESSSSVHNSINFERAVRGESGRETGWKRKAAAKGLKSLDVSTIDFPAIARFKQRIHAEGQVYSPGTYVTPKFGSYNEKVIHTTREEEGAENTVFSPELLAAFEDSMQQLQVEEDSILCYMDGYTPINNGNGESS